MHSRRARERRAVRRLQEEPAPALGRPRRILLPLHRRQMTTPQNQAPSPRRIRRIRRRLFPTTTPTPCRTPPGIDPMSARRLPLCCLLLLALTAPCGAAGRLYEVEYDASKEKGGLQ